uniref:Uncharacterized protein n=1 Tax=Acanthochromis polyacanthus TaxID=80966 RepID=A0A3Q1GB52_9TELE
MEYMKEVLREAKMDCWTAALLTVVAGVGTLLLLRRVFNGREAKEKIQRARNRRTESLRRAEEAVIRYKQSHQTTNLAPILELSLSQLTKQLHEGSLDPKDVFHSYMEKVHYLICQMHLHNALQSPQLSCWSRGAQTLRGHLSGCGDWGRGSAGGGAVCGPAVAGGALPALHEGGGHIRRRGELELRGCS